MKFSQLIPTRWSDGKRFGYTLYAIDTDGNAYKQAIHDRKHIGWIPMPATILPENWEHLPKEERKKTVSEMLPTKTEVIESGYEEEAAVAVA